MSSEFPNVAFAKVDVDENEVRNSKCYLTLNLKYLKADNVVLI